MRPTLALNGLNKGLGKNITHISLGLIDPISRSKWFMAIYMTRL